jgi:hypothetical protein
MHSSIPPKKHLTYPSNIQLPQKTSHGTDGSAVDDGIELQFLSSGIQ